MLRSFAKAALAVAMRMTHACESNLKSIFAALVLVGASTLGPSGAQAELEPVFDQLLLYNSPATLPTIEVEAEGQDWTRVSTETLHVTTNYYVSLKKGDILTIAATTSDFVINQTRHPGGGKRRWGEFHFQLPKERYEAPAISACNNKKQSGANTGGTHAAYVGLDFKLFVGAGRVGNPATKLVGGNVQAKVVCKRAPKLVEFRDFGVQVEDAVDRCPRKCGGASQLQYQ